MIPQFKDALSAKYLRMNCLWRIAVLIFAITISNIHRMDGWAIKTFLSINREFTFLPQYL